MLKWLLLVAVSGPVYAADSSPSQLAQEFLDCGNQLLLKSGNGSLSERAYDALERLGVTPPHEPLGEHFGITIDYPSFPQLTGNDVLILRYQSEQIAAFLSDLFVDVYGDVRRPFLFQEVVILPQDNIHHRPLVLEGTRLLVGVSHGRATNRLRWGSTAHELRRLWDAGEHLGPKSIEKKLWQYLNPAGTFRNGIRVALRKTSEELLTKIQVARGSSVDAKRALMLRLADHLAPVDGALAARVETLPEDALNKLVVSVQRKLEDPLTIHKMEEAGMARMAHSRVSRNYDIKLLSFVAVYGNQHGVHVDITNSPWAKFVHAIEKPQETRVRAFAPFFAGFTIDDISVNLDFSGSLEAAVISDALEEIP